MEWDPVHDARAAFLACLWALCDPGRPVGPLPAPGLSTDIVLDGAAGVLLALLDPGLVLAVAGGAEAERVTAGVRRMTGAANGAVEEADFVLAAAGAALDTASRARRGTALRPEAGATVVYAGGWSEVPAVLAGPGLAGVRRSFLPIPPGELVALQTANRTPPAGVDAFVVGVAGVTALPRSVSVRPGAG